MLSSTSTTLALLLVVVASVANGAELLFTTLALGFNRFEFVLLEAAVGGTEISFTDQGFITSSSTLRTGTTSSEGVLTWTAPFPKLDPGITVVIDFLGTPTATIGSVVSSLNTMDFSTGMDQVIAFTEDDFGVKTFIAAVTSQRASTAIFTDATDDFTTGLPTGLVVGESAVAFASSTSIAALKNFHFNVDQNLFPGGDVATMRAVLCDPGNWFRNNSNDIYGLNFIMPTQSPTSSPTTLAPTFSPTISPSKSPTKTPTLSPTFSPSLTPTQGPTNSPSKTPTTSPTGSPSTSPTDSPTQSPTSSPSTSPTLTPTISPTFAPSHAPSTAPTDSPSNTPTFSPTGRPSLNPTSSPSSGPTVAPTFAPSRTPTSTPTKSPTPPTIPPTISPTLAPTLAIPVGNFFDNPNAVIGVSVGGGALVLIVGLFLISHFLFPRPSGEQELVDMEARIKAERMAEINTDSIQEKPNISL